MSTATDHPQGLTKTSYQDATVLAPKYELRRVEGGSSDTSEQQFGSGYTHNDQRDMHRMGKNQEFKVSTITHDGAGFMADLIKRMFRSFSTFSFTLLVQLTWEVILL